MSRSFKLVTKKVPTSSSLQIPLIQLREVHTLPVGDRRKEHCERLLRRPFRPEKTFPNHDDVGLYYHDDRLTRLGSNRNPKLKYNNKKSLERNAVMQISIKQYTNYFQLRCMHKSSSWLQTLEQGRTVIRPHTEFCLGTQESKESNTDPYHEQNRSFRNPLSLLSEPPLEEPRCNWTGFRFFMTIKSGPKLSFGTTFLHSQKYNYGLLVLGQVLFIVKIFQFFKFGRRKP